MVASWDIKTQAQSHLLKMFFASTEVHGHPAAVQLYEPFPRLSDWEHGSLCSQVLIHRVYGVSFEIGKCESLNLFHGLSLHQGLPQWGSRTLFSVPCLGLTVLLLGTLFMFLWIEVLTRMLDGPLAACRRMMDIMCVFHVLECCLTLSLSPIAFECVPLGLLRPRSCHRKTGYFSFSCPIWMLFVSP